MPGGDDQSVRDHSGLNRYAQEKTGYQPEELIGKNILEFIPDSWQQAVSEQLIRQNIEGTCRPIAIPGASRAAKSA